MRVCARSRRTGKDEPLLRLRDERGGRIMNGTPVLEAYRKADFQEALPEGNVRCTLCPRKCVIAPGKTGYCAVRRNDDGELYSLSYGRPVALQIDPIEKKPLRHFMPGTRTYSIGTLGCNLGCVFCQNHHLSRCAYNARYRYRKYEPEELVQVVLRHGCESISFTYNEPTVFLEYVIDVARCAHEAGLKTILVSNGFIAPEAAEVLYPHMDAANFDMKGFSEEFYHSMCGGASLAPILEAYRIFKRCGGHAEYTNLVIPGKNDSKKMIDDFLDWTERYLGKETPIHFTAYHPDYRYAESPRTPYELIEGLQNYAKSRGFPNVYLGNIC